MPNPQPIAIMSRHVRATECTVVRCTSSIEPRDYYQLINFVGGNRLLSRMGKIDSRQTGRVLLRYIFISPVLLLALGD